ncbi:hypothetical protein NUU61_009633 [Penicillium alfredii]|uniref:CRIB domain-containing protein n=1 Tax=Penicillium alfredii TaxID=1506179 RepID=A0A9W9EGH7_9EURO|nr:uncharacterized protein NUU61_009633 [Penicillium alfredii]KAJ5081369.1 hypothetical protein NUU61_009633 [Penicillium alfredii]
MSTFMNYPMAQSHWMDNGSDTPSTRSSNEGPEHVHSRSRSTAHTHSPKRLSVFGGRSRSNTTTSTTSRRSPSSSMTSTDGSSQDERTSSALGFRAERPEKPRSFLARGSRILRRQGSKINIVATLDEADELDREQPRSEKSHFFSRHHTRQINHHEHLKSLISDPFDFHHLTHTNPSQFQSLDQTRENDLVTEFSAIRASQRPQTGLKGIRADDIHFRNFSTDNLDTFGTATTVDEPTPSKSPPASPQLVRRHARRESRINENFSRPVSRYPRSCPTTPPPPVVPETPPPDMAEPAPRAIDEILGLDSAKTYPEHIDAVPPTHLHFSPEPADDPTARSSSMSSHYDLEDVPEEEEATRYWDSPEPSEGPHSRSISQVSQPPVDIQLPSVAEPPAPLSIYVADELSQKFSEALGSPTLPQNLPNAMPHAAPKAHVEVTPPVPAPQLHQFSYDDEVYDSWDADIDYCYEHAAESTSNFDWSRTSLDETRPQVGVACSDEPWMAAPKTRHMQPSPLSTSVLATPDLDPSSARSVPSQSAATPSTADYERDFMARGTGDYFQPVSSSILPSTLGKQLPQDTLYEEYLATDAESDRHFPFVAQGMIAPTENPISPRSSFSPISKCNSQESLMLSRAASIVRKHRSSVSTTSVPELVHSLANSRELMPTDRQTAGETLAAGPTGPVLPLHRQTKSLAEAHFLLQTDSTTSLETADPVLTTLTHDRAKSTSEVDSRPVQFSVPPLPPVPPRNPNRKKGRTTSYSLFPTAAH